jgi:hypothetical protein
LNGKIARSGENNYFYEVGTDYYLMAAEPALKKWRILPGI